MTDETFSQALQRIRRERGVSYRQLAAACHINFGHLCKIEKGLRPCTVEAAEAIDRALDAEGALIAIARKERRQRARTAVPFDPMKRRTLVRWGATASALAGIGGFPNAEEPVGRVGAAEADRLLRAVLRLRQLGHLHGGEGLWQAATALVGDSHRLLEQGTYTITVEHRLLLTAGRAHMTAGWLAFDSGRHDVARTCYNEALNLGRQAGDAGIETHALANLAFQSNSLGRPREAVRLAETGTRVAAQHHRIARLAAMPHLRRAIAYATSADPGGSNAAISQARKILDREGDKPTADWCTFLTPVELDGVEGTCALKLGRPERAEQLLVRAVAGHADHFARNRALYRVRLARARLDRRVVDGSAEAANAALDDLSGELASWIVSTELASVADRFKSYSQLPEVERFLARYSRHAR
jgi:transcriptional regulator with XRE-family HTH domain